MAGADELAAAAERVAGVLAAPETATDAAQLVADIAHPHVPVDTGKLAASELVTPTATGGMLEYLAPYAVPVHARQPWLPAAIAAAEAPILDLYADRAVTAWS